VPTPGSPRAAGPGYLDLIRRHPAVLAAAALGLLVGGANEIFNVVYAAWLEQSFGLTVAQLGLTAGVIGAAELVGELLVMGLVDRLGKRRAVAAGLLVSALAYAVIPFTGGRLPLALGGLFFIFLAFEFTLVGSLPLLTEQVPEARFRVMSLNGALHAGGRMLGALLGTALFPLGIIWSGLAAALCNLLALALIVFFVRERRPA
jgi:MFS transporter, DHA1 family, inner membrane transport protein